MRKTMVVTSVLGVLGLGAIPVGPAVAQSRVLVPIVIQVPRTVSPQGGRPPSVLVTTHSSSPRPGVSATQITVQDATGALRDSGAAPRAGSPRPGVSATQITVQDATGALRDSGAAPRAGSFRPGVSTTQITVQDATGALRDSGAAPASSQERMGRSGQQTFIITSEAPIDAPIVILAQ